MISVVDRDYTLNDSKPEVRKSLALISLLIHWTTRRRKVQIASGMLKLTISWMICLLNSTS